MIGYNSLMRAFVESVKGKEFSQVIILAQPEATKVYRHALRLCNAFHHASSDWCQYSKPLTEMIFFLRNEVKYKQPDSDTNYRFHSIQNGIDQGRQWLI